MTAVNASGVARGGDHRLLTTQVVARWLHLAAAPSFTVMALATTAFDSGAPNALCAAAGGSTLGGMAPMYLLMAFFQLAPWLRLMSPRHR
ncbi:MAG TPA: hypothetical protein VFL62_05350 [Bradyrhizobium sp.]|uniref:hypothetical protein n=1 Tax=Bradyrhizobium sp. TaxID=376 RepID=UPI002D8071FF|nr:hypothetical protein [Bradyrhizobium sp.]HET7885635.1 hypothetical protein [Bradyrhizobium sp.]